MAKNRTWTDQQLIEAFDNSRSIRQILDKLHLRPTGGNYKSIKVQLQRLNLDQSLLKGQSWLKGTNYRTRQPRSLDEILVNGSHVKTSSLRKRLVREGVLINICVECKISDYYNNKPIVLHLDHIDGNNTNNLLENLRLLCPNCHSQTDTYCGKNIGKILPPVAE